MSFPFFVARRYLLARRKQAIVSVVTLIAILGVAVGTMALVIALALMTGFSSDIQSKILGAEAHVYVAGDNILGGIKDPAGLSAELRKIPHVVAVAANVFDEGVLEGAVDSDRVNLRGVDPAAETRVTAMGEAMEAGTLGDLDRVADGRPAIILGHDLALRLGCRVGDSVRYMSFASPTLSPYGPVPRRKVFRVVGLFKLDMYEYDRTWALISLAEAQKLMKLEGAVSVVKLKVDRFDNIPGVARAARALHSDYMVKDLLALNKPLFAAFKLEKLLMFIAIGLIVAVAALNIVTTLTMMVMEKSRDIGILMAMGATSAQVMALFMIQGLIIGLTGTALGVGGGCLLARYLDAHKVISLDTTVYYIPYLPFQIEPLDVALVALIAVLISFLATIWPALRAARLDPIEALRYE